jgi:major vault protein
MADSVIRIKPNFYIHVLDNNTNVAHVVIGPNTFTRKDHEKIIAGPEAMITVPPRHYCRIANPIVRDAKGVPVVDATGQVKIRHGDEEIRFTQEPFPLFPGETLKERP